MKLESSNFAHTSTVSSPSLWMTNHPWKGALSGWHDLFSVWCSQSYLQNGCGERCQILYASRIYL